MVRPNPRKLCFTDDEQAQEMPLFDVRARARSRDSATSHAAAKRVNRKGWARTQAARVLRALHSLPGATRLELAEAMNADRYMVARRLPDLREIGLVENGPDRRCRVCGDETLTWVVTDAGVRALDLSTAAPTTPDTRWQSVESVEKDGG